MALRTTLLSIGNRCRLGEDARRSQERVARCLALQGVDAQPERVESTLDDSGELLLSAPSDLGVDPLVIGVYGHVPMRDRERGRRSTPK